jgi:hypothetical protein
MPKATTQSDKVPAKILEQILAELRFLREQLSLVVPQDNLDEYDDADRLSASYRKAVKRYPPISAWK